MGIPGRTLEQLEPRAKVKIGEKRKSQRGNDYPAAVDYFVSDDIYFEKLYGDGGKPKALRISLAYADVDSNFSTGLERWLTKKGGSGQVLTCYTKDSGRDPIALRLTDFVQEGDVKRGAERGQRTPITCGADACPWFKDKSCKPMGRLVFFLEDDPNVQPLQLDTKSWHSIERVAAYLTSARRRGPLNDPGRLFELSVAFESKGTSRFPVLAITEVNLPISDNADVDLAELCVQAHQATTVNEARVALAALLDAMRPGWRDDQAYIDRIKEVGVDVALAGTLKAAEAKLS